MDILGWWLTPWRRSHASGPPGSDRPTGQNGVRSEPAPSGARLDLVLKDHRRRRKRASSSQPRVPGLSSRSPAGRGGRLSSGFGKRRFPWRLLSHPTKGQGSRCPTQHPQGEARPSPDAADPDPGCWPWQGPRVLGSPGGFTAGTFQTNVPRDLGK